MSSPVEQLSVGSGEQLRLFAPPAARQAFDQSPVSVRSFADWLVSPNRSTSDGEVAS